MYTSYFAASDATVYEVSESLNTGLDEILELRKTVDDASPYGTYIYNSRILIKFSDDEIATISSSMETGAISKNAKFWLNLYNIQAQEIPLSYTIYAYPVSQSWEMGTGRTHNVPTTIEGVSWKYRDGYTPNTEWISGSWTGGIEGSGSFIPAPFGLNATSSFSPSGDEIYGGGTWYTGSNGVSTAATQSFEYESADIRIDVSNIVRQWISGSFLNDGIIVKRSYADEQSTTKQGTLQFFSRDTHTIYPPKLEIGWDDSSFSTGTLSPLLTGSIELGDAVIYMKNFKKEYDENAKPKFRVNGRERFPIKTTTTTSQYLTAKYLPTSSYYSIKDAHTDETITPFSDDYSKLSCDSNGNYFKLWMTGMEPERYYRIVYKIEHEGDIEYYDDGYIFKVKK